MGLVELMKASDLVSAGEEVPQAYDNLPDAVDSYTFTLAAAATELAPQLVKGDLDIACVPANLAATLYQQTEGEVVTLGINTLGVLYIVENGNARAVPGGPGGQDHGGFRQGLHPGVCPAVFAGGKRCGSGYRQW